MGLVLIEGAEGLEALEGCFGCAVAFGACFGSCGFEGTVSH